MAKKIALGAVAILAILVGVIALQPSDVHVERSASMAAPAADVFAQVNDFHKWEAWSPWAKIDPAAKVTYEGPASGVGAAFAWDGNDQVGAGKMTITESKPSEHIVIRLDFFKPFAGTDTTEFLFKSDGKQTTTTWIMTGKKNFVSKAICMFVDMDKMVGGQYEKGLAAIKAIVEAPAKK